MKVKKTLSLFLSAVMLTLSLAPCGVQAEESTEAASSEAVTEAAASGDAAEEEASAEDTAQEEAYTPVTIENYDRTVEFTEKPEKVVVLTLNSAEILAALGEADSIVAIARNSNTIDDVLPEYYDALKDCAFPDEINSGIPTLEGMLSLEPDLVICNSYYFNVPDTFGTMEDYQTNGVEFYITECSYVTDCTIENTYNDIRNIGAIFGKQEEAEALIESMQERLDAVADTVSGQEPLKVLSLDQIDEDEYYVAGGTGLAENLIELAGGENIFADLDSQFTTVNIEEIIARDPDVIMLHAYTYVGDEFTQSEIDTLKNTEELSEVSAIKNDNIVVVPLFQVNPSIQNVNYVESLAAAMYPDLFE